MATQNYNDFYYFSFIAKNPHYGFATYKDPKTGHTKGYVVGYDKNGNPQYKYWHFNYDSQRIKRVGAKETDLSNPPQLAHEFLRNSPACMGSSNGEYVGGHQTGYYFKEIDDAKDAREAVDSRKLLIEAQSKALELKGEELDAIAGIIGVFNEPEEIKTHRVLDFSSNEPTKFLSLVKDPTLKIRALIRRCVNKGIFKEDGLMISWESKPLGADENEAVALLMKDQKLKAAVEAHLSKLG